LGVTDIDISIDAIVLDGVDIGDVDAFRADLMAELAGLAAGFPLDHPGGTAAVLRVAPGPGASPGTRVARSVWSSLVPSPDTGLPASPSRTDRGGAR
jgi:hypothetical protein